MNVIAVGYRRWAYAIFENLISRQKGRVWRISLALTTPTQETRFDKLGVPIIVADPKKLSQKRIVRRLIKEKPRLLLFYGWSWMIGKEILDLAPCLILHPSPLPKYRGGSPIQNQILAGEKESAVTLFAAGEGLDDGDIVSQKKFSLEGDLDDIFGRMIRIGTDLTMKAMSDLALGRMKRTPQDPSRATYCKRRKPEESEITLEEIRTRPAHYLYDKIRALQSPYPNAFIRGQDGKKVFLSQAKLEP